MKKTKSKAKSKAVGWYAIEEMQLKGEDNKARTADGIPFRVLGQIEDQLVVVVPPRVTKAQADRLSAIVEKHTKRTPFVFTDDVRFAKLRKLSESEAIASIAQKAAKNIVKATS